MKNLFEFLIFFYVAIFIQGCDFSIDIEPTSGNTVIRGKVIETSSKEPVSNVEIVLTYAAFMGLTMPAHTYEYTDANGNFNFEYYCEKDYTYTLHCEKDRYTGTPPYYYSIDKAEDNYFLIEITSRDSVR
ncbi:MAG: hypothetical protein JXR69_00870 [Candidatus Delongbacteria bacterium]|nr:hypothetical protein [Candidatus Delongbacteria bacterium]